MPQLVAFVIFFLTCHAVAGQEIPTVVLSDQHLKTCKVRVGDAMPGLQLIDPLQKKQALPSLYGKRATVVALVDKPNWMARQLLADLPRDVAPEYAARGVATVVVTVGRTPNAKEVNDGYRLLSDPTGEQFAKLGSARVPRVYVLDAKGKIAWFDIEYSRSTRRELKQTLAALLGPES